MSKDSTPTNTFRKELQAILLKHETLFVKSAIEEPKPGSVVVFAERARIVREETEQAICDLVEREVIGEDDNPFAGISDVAYDDFQERNDLRATQRAIVKGGTK